MEKLLTSIFDMHLAYQKEEGIRIGYTSGPKLFGKTWEMSFDEVGPDSPVHRFYIAQEGDFFYGVMKVACGMELKQKVQWKEETLLALLDKMFQVWPDPAAI